MTFGREIKNFRDLGSPSVIRRQDIPSIADHLKMERGEATSRNRQRLRFFFSGVCLVSVLLQLAIGSPVCSQSPANAPSIDSPHAFPTPVKASHDTPGVVIELDKVIRTDVDLALVNVTVTDPNDRIVVGLDQDNFRVYEDGVEQEIIAFSSEDIPVAVGIILDLSGSMKNKIANAHAAITAFLGTANKDDDFFLVGFNAHANLMSTFTHDPGYIQGCALSAAPGGSTALLDAIYLGISYMKTSKYTKRALLIVSDGGDNHSRHSRGAIKQLVREADVQLYAIGIYDPLTYPYKTLEEMHGPSLLEEITETTGGKVYPGAHLQDLPAIAARIGSELRNQYVLGYTPSNHVYDGQWRKIKVRLRPPRGVGPLLVHAKTGYYAKPQT